MHSGRCWSRCCPRERRWDGRSSGPRRQLIDGIRFRVGQEFLRGMCPPSMVRGAGSTIFPPMATRRHLLSFSLVLWGWWVDGESGVGEEGPGQLSVLVDAVDALFGGVGDIG